MAVGAVAVAVDLVVGEAVVALPESAGATSVARSDIWLVTAGTVVEVPLQAAAGVHPRGTAAVTGTARGPAALTVVVLGGVLHPMAAAQ